MRKIIVIIMSIFAILVFSGCEVDATEVDGVVEVVESVEPAVQLEYRPGDFVWCALPTEEGEFTAPIQFKVVARFDECVVVSRYFFEWEEGVDGMLDEMLTRTAMGYECRVFAFPLEDCYASEEDAIAAWEG